MKIDHIGIVVHSIPAALQVYQAALGLSLEEMANIPDQQVQVAFLPIGESNIELVQPTTEDSGIAKFLAKRGEGIHHICLEVDDIEAARAALDKALAINPDHPAALNQLGMLLRRNGKFLEAEAAYLKAVTAKPDYALAHYNLGVLNELYLQRLDSALQHFERYQEIVGGDEQVEKWITDLQRRVAASQRTANRAE